MTRPELSPDPTAATTRAIEQSVAPGQPDPTLATVRAIEGAQRGHAELVDVQLQVLNQRIDTVEKTARAERQGLFHTLDQRLNDIDRANVILADNVNRTPRALKP